MFLLLPLINVGHSNNICILSGHVYGDGGKELQVYLVYLCFPKSKASTHFLEPPLTAVSKSRSDQCFMSTNTIP